MAALADLPSLDGRSCLDLADTLMQNRSRCTQEIISRR